MNAETKYFLNKCAMNTFYLYKGKEFIGSTERVLDAYPMRAYYKLSLSNILESIKNSNLTFNYLDVFEVHVLVNDSDYTAKIERIIELKGDKYSFFGIDKEQEIKHNEEFSEILFNDLYEKKYCSNCGFLMEK